MPLTMHLTWDNLLERLEQPLLRCGYTAEAARSIAILVRRTIGMGISTHGIAPWIAVQRSAKPYVANSAATVEETAPAFAVIDASAVAPQIAMQTAVQEAVARAQRFGVGSVGVHHAGWVGALAPYLVDALEAGCPTMITGQSAGCSDCAPIGGLDPLFSTNPIAFAYGSLQEGMIADFSTAAISMGKTNQLIEAGKQAPDQWYRESDGRWTTDPTTMQRGGTLAFTGGQHGGHRGYALSLWTEAMAVWSGGQAHGGQENPGQNLVVTAYGAGLPHVQGSEVARLHELVRANRREDAAVPIRIPGERALRQLQRAEAEGVELSDSEVDLLDGIDQV